MCDYCHRFGEGKKWYFNPKYYSEEYIRSSEVVMAGIIELLGGPGKMDLEMGAAMNFDSALPDLKDQAKIDQINMLVERTHGGQIVPLEDAYKIVDLTKSIIVIPCYCRKYFSGGKVEKMTCMFLYPVSEMVPDTRPWEKVEKLTKEEAKARLKEFDKIGYVHGVYWGPAPCPVVICNCEYPYCIGLRARLHYNVKNAARKSHYICEADIDKCDGCGGEPKCIKRCFFGALKYVISEQRVIVDPSACFGCGVCRTACPESALKLKDRSEWPAFKDDW